MRRIGSHAVIVLAALVATALSGGPRAHGRPPMANPRVQPIVGVTIDSTAHLSRTIDSLRHVHRPMWTRLVLDVDSDHPASVGRYDRAAHRLARSSRVMAELVDSSDLRHITGRQVARRTRSYVAAMRRDVTVWEVGNEVNGNWTGRPAAVAQKVRTALAIVRSDGGSTALTLYENRGCGDGPTERSPNEWSRHYLRARTRAKLDYVLLSYYESQCHGLRPTKAQWTHRFRTLHRLYPNAKVGFGEIGMPRPARRSTLRRARSIIRRYYDLRLPVPAYVGGDFYWYYAEDMTPWRASPLWRTLKASQRT